MDREIIRISDYEEEDDWEEWEKLEVVDEKYLRSDLEKDYIENRIVVRRMEDGKFFEFDYIYSPQHGSDALEQIGVEVQRKTRTITETYYE